MSHFNQGEAVAVMSLRSNSPFNSMSIATVALVEGDKVHLADGRRYKKSDDQYVDEDHLTYIVPATRWHISVVHQRCLKPIC
jgi:hypothetical protein